VNPTRSQNSTETWRNCVAGRAPELVDRSPVERWSGGESTSDGVERATPATAPPHDGQKRARAGSEVPQSEQSWVSGCPHSMQKRESGAFSVPQFEQFTNPSIPYEATALERRTRSIQGIARSCSKISRASSK
jgi:hypothetical protein